jgi:hypothetical protein
MRLVPSLPTLPRNIKVHCAVDPGKGFVYAMGPIIAQDGCSGDFAPGFARGRCSGHFFWPNVVSRITDHDVSVTAPSCGCETFPSACQLSERPDVSPQRPFLRQVRLGVALLPFVVASPSVPPSKPDVSDGRRRSATDGCLGEPRLHPYPYPRFPKSKAVVERSHLQWWKRTRLVPFEDRID